MKTLAVLLFSMSLAAFPVDGNAQTEGKDYYVSSTRGKGRLGTKEQPAKDLAAIANLLEPGDRVHIAEGKYISKTGRGTDIIEVPVSIYGGYSSDFNSRDPWGNHKTILTGKK